MEKQHGRIAVLSDEGEIFSIIAGKYHQGQAPDCDAVLVGYDGGHIRQQRISRGLIDVPHAHLSIVTTTQPTTIESLENKQILRGKGFFGRFLFSLPKSMLGTRETRAEPVSEEAREAYQALINKVLGNSEIGIETWHELFGTEYDPKVLQFSEKADDLLAEFEEWLEPQLAPFEDLGAIAEWGSKLAGKIVRIASFIHVAENDVPEEHKVSPDAVVRAIKIAGYYIAHSQTVLVGLAHGFHQENAEYLLYWFRKNNITEINERELHQRLRGGDRFKDKKVLEMTLKRLKRYGYAVEKKKPKKKKGGRPSITWLINPLEPEQPSTKNPADDFFRWLDIRTLRERWPKLMVLPEPSGDSCPLEPPSPPPSGDKNGQKTQKHLEAYTQNTQNPSSEQTFSPKEDGGEGVIVPFPAPPTQRIVESVVELEHVTSRIEHVEKVALDLETMPPEGWIWEVVGEYRSWRRNLKKKPKRDRQRKKWQELKEKTYKKYATDTTTAQPRLLSVATHDGLNEVVDVTKVDTATLLEVLKNKTIITHSGAFDLGVLRERYGYVHEGRVLDTQLLYILHHYAQGGSRTMISGDKKRLPDPTTTKIDHYGTGKRDTGMSALVVVARKYLGVDLDKGQQASDWSLPKLSNEQVGYALGDTKVLIDLSEVLIEKLEAISMGDIVELESRSFAAQVDMELNGFLADKTVALAMADKYLTESREALKKVHDLLPQEQTPDRKPWNWNRDEDIRSVLRMLGAKIDHKKYPKTSNTKEPSTSRAALSTIEDPPEAREWVEAYLEYLSIYKRSRDFASKYAGLIDDSGCIRGSFATISTGRLRCQKPNLQQVPKRGHLQTLEGMRIRDIFRPKAGDVFIVADFAQVELLLAATIAARETGMEPHMLSVFREGRVDIHRETAAAMVNKLASEVTKEERTLAKAANFGLIYGAEAETLLEYARNNYGIKEMTLADARRYRKAFFKRYPELAEWHRKVERRCDRGHQYSTTPLGRRRKLPTWAKSNTIAATTAKNSPVQGAGADAIKLTMAKLFEDRHNCPGSPRLNCCIHDEVILSIVEEHKDVAVEWVKRHMAAAEREAVKDPDSPIVVDVEAKYSWGR